MLRAALVMLLAVLPVAASAAPAPDGPIAAAAAKPKCLGKAATIVGSKRSDKGRKKIVGTRKADVIVARGGVDDIRGRGGNDLICADAGNDRVDGGSGKDVVVGGAGKDRLKGGAGDDALLGGAGDDMLDGGAGTDACDGGKGKNRLRRCEAANLPPVAVPDALTTTEDVQATVPVLANDTDPDGDALKLTAVSPAGTKAAFLLGDAGVVYDPSGKFDALPAGRTVVETFSYVVADAKGATATGTVTATVVGVDDAPVAVADTAATEEGAPKAIDVLANDTDLDGGPKKITSVDTFGSTGTVQITDTGVVYTPGIGVCDATDSFSYTLEGGSTAKVTVTVGCAGTPPTAVDDAVTVTEDAASAPVDVLLNDTDPDGGPKRVLSAGDPAHGTATVSPEGVGIAYAPDADYCGVDSFTYTLNGGSTATVSVTVTCVEDAPTAAADATTVAEDAGATAVPVLANDTDPDGGTKTVQSVTQPGSGSVAITGGGTGLTYAPAANFCGADSFTYTLDGGSVGTVNVTVTCVNDAPVADDETFSGATAAVGNTPLAVGTSHAEPRKAVSGDVLTGDTDVDSASLTAATAPITTTNGGTVAMEPDGQFVYHPPAGFTGNDNFSYTVTDGDRTDTGLVTIAVADRVWYVNPAAAAGGNGTGAQPFNSLASLGGSDPDGPGDRIFLSQGTYTGNLLLEATQELRSRTAGLVVGGHTLVTAAPNSNATIGALTLGTGNTVQGVNAASITGAGFGIATINTTHAGSVSNPAGAALDLTTGTLNATLTSVASAGSATNAIRLNNVAGTVAIGGGALTNATGPVVLLNGGSVTFSSSGTITDDLGRLVEITNKTGGSHTFSGAISDGNDGDGDGVYLGANANAVVTTFSGGLTLSTGTSRAIDAPAGGTLNITGAANTLATTAATALRLVGTAVGAGGLTFKSISSIGGGSSGIVLENTGPNHALTVTGDGTTPGSGGAISDKTGTDNDLTTGTGIVLTNVNGVSLSRMQIDDHQNYAIRGSGVTGFKLLNSVVNGANGTNAAIDEAAVSLLQLTGTGSEITGSTISGGVEDNLQVHNSSGTLNRLTVGSSTIGHNGAAEGNDGIGILVSGTAVVNATIQNSTFHGARGDTVDHNVSGTSSSDLVLLGNTMHNTHPNIVAGGGGITISSSNSGDLTYDVDGNSIRGSKGSAIVVCKCFGGAPGDATAAGTIENNTIGLAGSANSGSSEGSGIAVTQLARGRHSSVIRNNQIRRYSNYGILMTAGGAAESVTGLSHDGAANFTIHGNTIAEPNAPAGGLAHNGIHLNSGTNTGDDYNVCLNLGSPTKNTLTGSGALGGTDYRLRQRFDTDVRMPGYTGVANDPSATGSLDSALITYLTPRTNGTFTLSSSSTSTGGFFNTAGGAACSTT